MERAVAFLTLNEPCKLYYLVFRWQNKIYQILGEFIIIENIKIAEPPTAFLT